MQGAELAREVAFSDAAMRLLQSRQWPGNVRELQSAVARAIAFCGASVITSDDLRPFLESPGQVGIEADAFDPIKANLLRALQRGENDTLRAAMLLGVHRSTIYRQMRRFGIALPRFHGRGALEPVVE
jgi:transcriptional regulator of acetoin/glycerol metabolism